MVSIAKETAKTSFWSAIDRFFSLGVNLVVQLLLARMLSPSDFGVIAMLAIFINVAQSVSECGFTNALIRKQDCNQDDYSTAFYLNLGISSVIYVLFFFIAPYIASFYEMPLINGLLRVYSFVFIFDALRVVQYSKLCRRLDFRSIALISSAAVFLSGIIGLYLAYTGYGAWALVGQTLSSTFFYFVFLSIKERWQPSLSYNKESFHYLWTFGSRMIMTGVISRVYSNIYGLIIGKFYAPSTLGLFNNGQKYSQFYPSLVESIFVKNSLPILSNYQSDNNKLSVLYRKYVQLVSFLTFPVCVFLFVFANQIIILLFTEKWIDCVIYFRIFAITALLIPANTINLNILQVKGRTDYTLKAEVIKKGIGSCLIFILFPFGPVTMALGSSLMGLFAYSVNIYYARKVIGVSYKDQAKDLSGLMITSFVSATMSAAVLFVNSNNFVVLLLGASVYFSLYFLLTKYILKIEFYNQIGSLLIKR